MAKLTSAKAKIMLSEGSVKGHPLTAKQKGFFGLIAGGGKPTRRHQASMAKARTRKGNQTPLDTLMAPFRSPASSIGSVSVKRPRIPQGGKYVG